MKKRAGHVYCRNGIFWIKFYSEGVPQYESSESHKKSDAETLLKRRLGEVVCAKYSRLAGKILVGELLDGLLQNYRVNNPKSYDDFAVPFVKRLQSEFGKHKASAVTTAMLTRY